MTSFELAEELCIKESYLRTHWPKIVESNARMGVTLIKMGRGERANYGIRAYDDDSVRWEHKKR